MDPRLQVVYVDGFSFSEDDRVRQRAHWVLERVRTRELLPCVPAAATRDGARDVGAEPEFTPGGRPSVATPCG